MPVAIDAAGEKLSKQTHARALPEDPLPALLAAWRFLDQPDAGGATLAPTRFWAHAFALVTRAAAPGAMLPAPRMACGTPAPAAGARRGAGV